MSLPIEQRMLEDQGYLVVGCYIGGWKHGDILKIEMSHADGIPAVMIAESSRDEFEAQLATYCHGLTPPPEYPQYVKVVAE